MTDKLELKSSHEVINTVDVADVESIFYCKPTDPDILTVLMKDGKRLYCDEVCPIDSLQEEPSETSNVWFDARNSVPEDSTKQIICIKEDGLSVATVGKIVTGTIKWAYLDTLLHISNKNLTESQCRKLIDTAFELGKAANKDKPVSEGLEEELAKLLKDCEVDAEYIHQDFLYIVAHHFADWQKRQTVNKACKWLDDDIEKYINADGECNIDWNFINDFKKRLEE